MTSKISRLMTHGLSEEKSWNNIVLSSETIAHRKQLKQGMDDFTSFTWRGVDAFDVFGAFIINNKNTLKFYNGPTFSNEYTKPQFESAAGQLVGVSFGIQKIDFTIGVYWISEEDYRKLIDWLNPYEINTLTFGFEPEYYYLVKLASIGDAIRHIVGTETIEKTVNNKTVLVKEYQYYTEIKLTFEIQGDPCAYYNTRYEWEGESSSDISIENLISDRFTYIYKLSKDNNNELFDENKIKSDLAMPFKYKMHIKLAGLGIQYLFNDTVALSETEQAISFNTGEIKFINNNEEFKNLTISKDQNNITTVRFVPIEGEPIIVYNNNTWIDQSFRVIDVIYHPINISWNSLLSFLSMPFDVNQVQLDSYLCYNSQTIKTLFNISFNNLSIADLNMDSDGYYLDIIYDSATGLLYWDRGDSQLFLLSRLNTVSTGSRLVDAIESYAYKIPGVFDDWNFDISKVTIETTLYWNTDMIDPQLHLPKNFYIDMRARTNLI